MALPNSVNAASPAGTDSSSLGDDQFRDLKTFLEDIFSIPDTTNIAAAGLDFVAAGLQTVIFQDAAANPGTAGYLQRNAANLLFHDGTAARTIAFLENNPVFAAGTESGAASVQAIAGDVTLAAGYGSSTSTAPVYGAAIMGNVDGANLTASANIIAGVIGKYEITGTNASTYPKAGVIGEIGDNDTSGTIDNADAAVMAVLGGDAGRVNADAAFAVDILNSTPNSGFAIGLDLYRAAHDGYLAAAYSTAAMRVPNASWIMARNAADNANVNMIRITSANAIALGGAGSAGTILRSDGTNLVSSTATYPNAATSGGVLYASAADVWATSGLLTANAVMKGGGAGAAPTALTDPGADRLIFWDESSNDTTYLTVGSGLTITDTTITASAGITGTNVDTIQVVRKTADNAAVNNSTTLVNDDHLTASIAANEIITFIATIFYSTGATPTIKFAFTVPAAATLAWSFVANGSAVIAASGTTLDAAGSGSSSLGIMIQGTVVNGANSGSLTLQFAQLTANASNTFTLANSTLTLFRNT